MKQLNAHHNRQQGGTLLGLIIGLVVGLGIAVVVALMITKTPVPFVDKVGKQERLDTSSGRIEDPNKPMYGSRPAKPASETQISTAPATAPVAPVAPQVDAKPAATTEADDKWIYYLQAGAFRAWDEAEGERARLALLGFEAKITERNAENGTLYRVRVGPFAQAEAMNKVRGRMSENGIDFAVIRSPK